MKKLIHIILISAIVASLAISYTSCTQSIPQLPVKTTEASADDYEAMSSKISQLESRIEQLEQGLDERVIEYNIVKSALIQMVLDNDLIDTDWGNVSSLGTYFSSWAPTNDMRLFPSPDSPLFGYDKNEDYSFCGLCHNDLPPTNDSRHYFRSMRCMKTMAIDI